jgi:TolB-like protein/DNA-binding winged helix-turn-helix (wHTH) protein/tetratricopeptide (TPR) repeat protein
MSSEPLEVQQSIRFGEDFHIDFRPRRLRRGNHVLKVERIPLEILLLLVEHRGEIVGHSEIVARIWGSGVFLDTENSIRGAIRKMRQVLKDDPEQPRFIETVTGRGYRFIAPVADGEQDAPQSRQDATTAELKPVPPNFISELDGWLQSRRLHILEDDHRPPDMPPWASDRPSYGSNLRRWLLLCTVALCVLLAVTYIAVRSRRIHAANLSELKIKSVAVLPLKNLSDDASQEYLADGMTEELIGRLAAIRDLRVTSRTSVMRFKNTQLSVPEIARQLSVDAVVEGSVIREGDRIRVHAQLIRAATDEHFWSQSYDRELRDALALESEVAESIAERVAATVTGSERSQLIAARHITPEVYESYLQGRFALNRDTYAGVNEAIRYFEQAAKGDPTFAPAYLGLAEAYDGLASVYIGGPPHDMRPKVISAAQKALQLDPDLPAAHVLLAKEYQIQYRWADADSEYSRALELRPNDAAAHEGRAFWLLAEGRTEEAVAWGRRGRELDPVAVKGDSLAWILFNARHFDEAIEELHSALGVTPDDPLALWHLGFVLIVEGKPNDAIPILEKSVAVSHRSPAMIGVLIRAYARAGRRTDALRALRELQERRRTTYVPAAAFIQAYAGLNDNDQTLAWLEQGYKEQSNLMQWIKVEPTFDQLRSDPRFVDLLRRVGLN